MSISSEEWHQEVRQTLADLDVKKLEKEIIALRGTAFKMADDQIIRSFEEDEEIGTNIHIPIVLEDGCEWFLRVPGFADRPEPPNISAQIRTSEALTYKALRSGGVLVPEVYSWGAGTLSKRKGMCETRTSVLMSDPCFMHILYSKLPGSPAKELETLDIEQLGLFIDTYALQAIKMSAIKFDAVGGLRLNDMGETVVGGSVDTRETNMPGCHDLGGPFKSTRAQYLYRIEACLKAIEADMLFRVAPLHAYLAYLEVKRMVLACELLKEEEHDFYLRHPDAASQHLDVADRAETTSKAAAFRAPRWAVDESFMTGNMALGGMELRLCEAYEKYGRKDLADCVRGARVHHLLEAFLSVDWYSSGEVEDFLPYFQAMVSVLDPDSKREPAASLRQWVLETRKFYENEDGLAVVLELDRLRRKGSRRRSVVVYPIKKCVLGVFKACGKALARVF